MLSGRGGIAKFSTYARLVGRQRRSRPFDCPHANLCIAPASGKSPLDDALAYIAKYSDGLCLFLADGRVEML